MAITLYDIANNRPLLAKMTQEEGEQLTYEEQLAKLESLTERKRARKHDIVEPPALLR